MNPIRKPIVIVGGGFAGINASLNLKKTNPDLPIIVIDSQTKFVFKPLLYELLSNELNHWEVTPSYENIFSSSGIIFLNNHLSSVNFQENYLHLKDGVQINYQYLVLCTGSSYNNFSIKGVDEYCYFFNDNNHQKRLKFFLEESKRKNLKTKISIVGAGPSGVELACKIYDLLEGKSKISLIERSSDILINNKVYNREEAEKAIFKRKIDLMLNTSVIEVTDDQIIVANNSKEVSNLKNDVVIWTAGVKPNLSFISQDIKKLKEKILINRNLQLISYENVFAVGDVATIEAQDLPTTAQVAMQQGKHVAKNISLMINDKDLLPFEFQDNGEMISLGIGDASISGLGLTISGKLAFELRRLVYASKMPSFEESIKSATSWLINKKSKFRSKI